MSILAFDSTAAASHPAAHRSKADALRVAALGLLSIRFIQGFIYWGGGSRRFIYAPAKTISSPFCCSISIFSLSR
jgi:hypothetical protein